MKKFIFLFFILFLFSGCQKPHTVEENKNNKNVNINFPQGKMDITGDKGEKISFHNEKISENLPSDIPVYPNSIIDYTISFTENHMTNLSMSSEDNMKSIEGYYKKELSAKGWDVKEVFSGEENSVFKGKKKDRTITVTITMGSEKKNSISISSYEGEFR